MKIKTLLTISLMLIGAKGLQAQDLKPFLADNKKYGYKDDKGTIVVEAKYDIGHEFSEGMAIVTLNYKYGFIDKKGTEVIPLKYHLVRNFSEGLACVNIGTTFSPIWGFIDLSGKEVIAPQYDQSAKFINGKAEVKKNNRSFYIDKTGKELVN